MPNKAKSKSQFRFLQGVKHGSIEAPGLSPEAADEMLGAQSPKSLPERKSPQSTQRARQKRIGIKRPK